MICHATAARSSICGNEARHAPGHRTDLIRPGTCPSRTSRTLRRSPRQPYRLGTLNIAGQRQRCSPCRMARTQLRKLCSPCICPGLSTAIGGNSSVRVPTGAALSAAVQRTGHSIKSSPAFPRTGLPHPGRSCPSCTRCTSRSRCFWRTSPPRTARTSPLGPPRTSPLCTAPLPLHRRHSTLQPCNRRTKPCHRSPETCRPGSQRTRPAGLPRMSPPCTASPRSSPPDSASPACTSWAAPLRPPPACQSAHTAARPGTAPP